MLKFYLLLAWRNLLKRKFYSTIELAGLSIGIACFLLTMVYVRKEMSFELFFDRPESIYRLLNVESGNRYSGIPSALALHARLELPQIDRVVRVFFPYRMYSNAALVRHNDVRFYEENVLDADSNFFEMFSFRFLEGNPKQALVNSTSVVMSQDAAQKYFGNGPALGRLITIDNGPTLMVTGVVDVPKNTHLNFDFIRPAHHDPSQEYVWDQTLSFTYLQVNDARNVPLIEEQLYSIMLKNSSGHEAEYLKNVRHQLQPLNAIHNEVLEWDITTSTSYSQLWVIFTIALFVLLLAITNFINLSTARASERMHVTGISKILGASQGRLIFQYFLEFLLIIVVAGVLSVCISVSSLPLMNRKVGISILPQDFWQANILMLFTAVLVLTAVLAGLYPAYSLTRFRPALIVNRKHTASGGARLRQALVIFQFIISIGLLSGTFIIQEQIDFMQNTDLGFDRDHVLIIDLHEPNRSRFEQLRNEIASNTSVMKIAGTGSLLGGETGSDTFYSDRMPDQTPETFAKNIAVDYNFLDLIGVPLLAGRNFQPDKVADFQQAFILNETAVKQFRLMDPVGASLRRSGKSQGKVIGVMKDFHFAKMTARISPMVFYLDSVRSYQYMMVKMKGNIKANVELIEKACAATMPEYPVEYFFQDEYFAALYKQEQQLMVLTAGFSWLSIFLACLGLFGLSSFMILQRTKEIGIRKVVGATVMDVLVLLSKNYLLMIGPAFFISGPIVWYFGSSWLNTFAYRKALSIELFLWPGLITLTVAFLTISVQSVRAALANPVESIRQE